MKEHEVESEITNLQILRLWLFVSQTALEAYVEVGAEPITVEEKTARRVELGAACCLLLKVCLSLIHGVHDLQYTAMVTINKVIDAAVVHSLGHVRVRTSTALHHPCNDRSVVEHEQWA